MAKYDEKYKIKKPVDVKVFLAADAFLYLPIYAAKELGIFEQHKLNVTISAPTDSNGKSGDDVAITKLSEFSEKKKIGFAIASAAPLLSDKTERLKEIDNCIVIGSLISKLSYWALNHSTEKYKSIKGLVSPYKNIIHYDENFREGNYLGKKLREVKKLKPILIDVFGKEFDVLEKNNCIDDFIVSASLEKIVSEIEKKNFTSINYSFSQDEEIGSKFLTTAIISKKIIPNSHHEKVAIQFLIAIQKTILTIYSSSTVARHCIVQINEKYKFNLTPTQKTKAMEIIREEKFYKNDLNIGLKSWTESMKALELSEWISMTSYNKYSSALKIRRSYKDLVDNSIAHKSERLLAEELGINKHSFIRFTDSSFYKKIDMIIGYIKLSYNNFFFKWISISILIFIIFLYCLNYTSAGWNSSVFLMISVGILLFISRDWRNIKKK